MRTINQLLIVLREHTEQKMENGCLGLCAVVDMLGYDGILKIEEEYSLADYIVDYMPKYNEIYGWPPRQTAPRLAWLDRQIKDTKYRK